MRRSGWTARDEDGKFAKRAALAAGVLTAMVIDRDQQGALNLIQSLVDETGLSVTEIARRAGIAPSTLTRIYPTPSVKYTLSARTLSKLRQVQGAPRSAHGGWPMPAEKRPVSAVREEPTPFMAQPDAPVALHLFASIEPPADSPLAASGLEILSGSLTESIQRKSWPLAYGRGDRYFLIYMPDDSMAPRFKSGDCLLIDKVKPPAAGSEVMVVFDDASAAPDVLACIALLVERDRSQIRLKQYGGDVVATVLRRDVAHSYAIVGSFDDLP